MYAIENSKTPAPSIPRRPRLIQTGLDRLGPVCAGPYRLSNGLSQLMPSQTPTQTVRDSIWTGDAGVGS